MCVLYAEAFCRLWKCEKSLLPINEGGGLMVIFFLSKESVGQVSMYIFQAYFDISVSNFNKILVLPMLKHLCSWNSCGAGVHKQWCYPLRPVRAVT